MLASSWAYVGLFDGLYYDHFVLFNISFEPSVVAIFLCNVFWLLLVVEGVLRKGHVPPPPQNFVSRPELIKAIRKELRKLKDEDCWVLVSGLPGYGQFVILLLL